MKRPFPAPGLRFEVAEDYEAMSRRAASIILASLKQQPDLLLCASAGGTPIGAYQSLARAGTRQPGLFTRLRVLQIDEWTGLPASHPATCQADLRRKLVEPLGLDAKRFVAFRSDAESPQAECERVATWLAAHGPIDLCILGLGLNGHIAMNEPGAAMHPQAHIARLAPGSRQHGLLKNLARKPKLGLTLGLREILQSRKILLLVSGTQKHAPLRKLATARVTTRFPASFLWLHPDATVLCDREAAP